MVWYGMVWYGISGFKGTFKLTGNLQVNLLLITIKILQFLSIRFKRKLSCGDHSYYNVNLW